MIKAWIKANPLIAAGIAGLAALLIVLLVTGFFSHVEKQADKRDAAHEQVGQQKEQLKSNEETLNAVQNAQRPVSDPELDSVRSKFDRDRHSDNP